MKTLKEMIAHLLKGENPTYDEQGATKQAKKRIARSAQMARCAKYNLGQRWWRKYQVMIVKGLSREEFEELDRIRFEGLRDGTLKMREEPQCTKS